MGPIECNIDPAAAADYRARGWWRDRTIVDEFLGAAERTPDKAAIVSRRGIDTEVLTYRQLALHSERFAACLMELGIRQDDVVSFQLPNCWQFVALHLACVRIGAISNPIVPILRRREVGFILERTQSKVCVVFDQFRNFEFGKMLADVKAATRSLEFVFVIGSEIAPGTLDFNHYFVDAHRDRISAAQLDLMRPHGDSVSQIQFTSGTTGEPKGVVHTHNTLALSVRAAPEALGIGPEDVMLMSSPLAHNTGFIYGMSMPLTLGMKSVLQDIWDPMVALDLIEQEGVTLTMGSTTFLMDLCEAAATANRDTSSLRFFLCGGAPIPAFACDLVRARLGATLMTSWGMTENGMATTTRPGDPPEKIAASAGTPLPWVQLKVVDESNHEVPCTEQGRLFIRAANEHVAYLGRPDLYAAAVRDGWFDTGDLARIDDAGYLRITGRTKDVIIRGGENVPVLEVEAALLDHSLVKDVAVVGVPDERLGERACAVVVPVDETQLFTLSDLTAHLEKVGMARTFWPERLEIRSELPRTASGKVQKFVLRNELAALEPQQKVTPA